MNAIEICFSPDVKLLPSVLSAIKSYSEIFFKDRKDVDRIVLSTEEAINNVLSYSATNHLKNITVTADGRDGEFTVSVLDKGLPGDYDIILEGKDRLGLTIMQNAMDVVIQENLGMAGRCQKLIKYYSCVSEFSELHAQPEAAPATIMKISVRIPKKTEMNEISRLIYQEYGLTYSRDIVYYPERFFAAVLKDLIHSLVAVDENDNIAGHIAAFQWDTVPGVWEMGMGVVSRHYRKAGIALRMMQQCCDYVKNDVNGRLLIGCCVTTHKYTQSNCMKCGLTPCGFLLNLTPPDVLHSSFKSDERYTANAVACLVFDSTPKKVYLPEELRDVANKIYTWQKLSRIITMENDAISDTAATESKWFYNTVKRNGTIYLYRLGQDHIRCLHNNIYELKRHGAEMIVLYIPIEQPGLTAVYENAKNEGFFFTGLLPATDHGDVVIMQKMMNNIVDYKSLVTYDSFTELLDDIQKYDPDVKWGNNSLLS